MAAAFFSACRPVSFKPDEPINPVALPVIKATLPDTLSAEFATGDMIEAFKPSGTKTYIYMTEASGKTSEFKFISEGEAPKQIAYVTYPAAIVDSLIRGKFYLSIPQAQDAVSGDVDPKADIFVGRINNGVTDLTPVPAYLKFTIAQIEVFTCTISADGNKGIAGPVSVAMTDTIAVSTVPNTAKTVQMQSTGMGLGSSYMMAVMPGEYSSFNVTLKNSLGVVIWDSTVSGEFNVTPGQTADLGNVGNPDASTLNFKFTSEQYAGYKLKSIIAYSTSTLTRVFGSEFDNTIVAGQENVASCYGVDPKDYSSDDMWYLVLMESADDSVVLPMKMKGPNIEAASIVDVNLGAISEDRNGAPWYYPHMDKRLMCGDGYAFGEANTYFIQCKTGTYGGATFNPDPKIPDEVVIDYRARGDFITVPRPEDVTFEFKMGYGGNSDTNWQVHVGDLSKIGNGRNFTITHNPENYTVTVKNTGAHAQAPILLMRNKDGEVMWAWAFWNVAADGTRVTEPVKFGDVDICKLDIGQSSTEIATFVAKETELRRTTYYYQWGRTMPIFWQNTTKCYFAQTDARNATGKRMPVCDKGPVTILQSIQHAGEMLHNPFTTGVATDNLNDWTRDGVNNHADLWGGSLTAPTQEEGTKSIYDPCPKGWRVADYITYASQFPAELKPYDETKYHSENTTGYQGVYLADGVLFCCSGNLGTSVNTTPAIGNGGFSAGTGNTAHGNGLFWTNAYASSVNAYVFRADYYYMKYDKATVNANRTIGLAGRAVGAACPVRCQVDKDNR